MSRFLCCGDLHLDKGGRYGRVPGERLAEQEKVWAEVLGLARHHRVDAVLFAGDAFEKRHPSTDALLAFERPLVHHQVQGGPPVIAIPGNHDRSGVSDYCALDVFAEAGLIDLYSRPTVPSVAVSVDDDVAIACLPWAPVSRIVAAHDGEIDRDDVNTLAAELLIESARGLRAQIPADWPCLLLTHFSISGAVTPDGADVGMFREPVLQIADLEAIGFDAVIAGHIHKPQEIGWHDFAALRGPIFYTGSPMPLDFGEGRCEHGVWLIDLEQTRPRFLPLESRDFVTLDWDYSEAEALLDIEPLKGCGRPFTPGCFVKLRYSCTSEEARWLDTVELRRVLVEEFGAYQATVELQVERELRARVAGIDETVSDTDALDRWIESQSHAFPEARDELLSALHERHAGYLQEIS